MPQAPTELCLQNRIPSGLDERLEQSARSSIRFDEHLRMPLHTNQVVVRSTFESLDQSIRRIHRSNQTITEPLDALMMHRIHLNLFRLKDALQYGSRRNG